MTIRAAAFLAGLAGRTNPILVEGYLADLLAELVMRRPEWRV